MTSGPHRRAIGSLRAVALDAPDIDHLATFYEQLAAWRRVPGDDDDWITLNTGDGWRIGLQQATGHVPPDWPGQSRPQQAHLDFRVPDIDAAAERAQPARRHCAAPQRAVAHAGRPGRPSVRPVPQPGRTRARTILMGVMLDCPDAKALSHFYAELLGKPVTYEADGAAMIGEDGAQPVMFQQVERYTAPRWPDPAYPQQSTSTCRSRTWMRRNGPPSTSAPPGWTAPAELARLRRSGRQAILSDLGGLGRGRVVSDLGGLGRGPRRPRPRRLWRPRRWLA